MVIDIFFQLGPSIVDVTVPPLPWNLVPRQARHVTETLKSLSRRGRSVILSIHQPRSDVFALLDDVVLLSRGRLVWSGPSDKMLEHFLSRGLECPSLTNPAEFILDISSVDVSSPTVCCNV